MKKNNPDLPINRTPQQTRGGEDLLKTGQPLTAVLKHYERNIRRFKRTWYATGLCFFLILATILVLFFSQ